MSIVYTPETTEYVFYDEWMDCLLITDDFFKFYHLEGFIPLTPLNINYDGMVMEGKDEQ